MLKRFVQTAVAALALSTVVAAQGAATPADAAKFIGDWSITLDTPQGAMAMDVKVKEAEGKLTGEAGSAEMGTSPITDISRAGESLVLKYLLDFQGTPVPIKITLTPSGEKMAFNFDAADGQFMLDGAATKK